MGLLKKSEEILRKRKKKRAKEVKKRPPKKRKKKRAEPIKKDRIKKKQLKKKKKVAKIKKKPLAKPKKQIKPIKPTKPKKPIKPTKPTQKIETSVDQVYYIVLEKKRLSLKSLANRFKIGLDKLEEWAKILDEKGLLELHYPVVGEVELRVRTHEFKKTKPKDKKMNLLIFTAILLVVVALSIFFMIKFFYS